MPANSFLARLAARNYKINNKYLARSSNIWLKILKGKIMCLNSIAWNSKPIFTLSANPLGNVILEQRILWRGPFRKTLDPRGSIDQLRFSLRTQSRIIFGCTLNLRATALWDFKASKRCTAQSFSRTQYERRTWLVGLTRRSAPECFLVITMMVLYEGSVRCDRQTH